MESTKIEVNPEEPRQVPNLNESSADIENGVGGDLLVDGGDIIDFTPSNSSSVQNDAGTTTPTKGKEKTKWIQEDGKSIRMMGFNDNNRGKSQKNVEGEKVEKIDDFNEDDFDTSDRDKLGDTFVAKVQSEKLPTNIKLSINKSSILNRSITNSKVIENGRKVTIAQKTLQLMNGAFQKDTDSSFKGDIQRRKSVVTPGGEFARRESVVSANKQKKKERRVFTKKLEAMLFDESELYKRDPPVMNEYSYKRIMYKLDRAMAKKSSQITIIFSSLMFFIFLFGIIYKLVLEPEMGIFLAWWVVWGFLVDQGLQDTISESSVLNHTWYNNAYNNFDDGYSYEISYQTWSQRLFGGVMCAAGIVLTSIITAFIVDGIRDRMEFQKTGKRIVVVETNHIVMIGWTDKSISIIRQLAEANKSIGGVVIVVLATANKEDIELEILRYFPNLNTLLGTKIVVTLGIKTQAVDLLKVCVHHARCILVLSDNSASVEGSDAGVLQTVLCLKSLEQDLCGFIVCELLDRDNERLVKLVGGNDVELIVTHDIIGRLMVMSSREPGLSRVYESILGFEEDEFYIKQWPELEGKSFRELLLYFPDAILVGTITNEGLLNLSPSQTTILTKSCYLVVIAADDNSYAPSNTKYQIQANLAYEIPPPAAQKPEKLLLCGWRRDIRDVLQFMDVMLHKGSELHLLSERSLNDRNIEFNKCGFNPNSLKNISLVHYIGAPNVRRNMELMEIEKYKAALIFADEKLELDVSSCDSISLSTLILIRDIQSKYAQALDKEKFDEAKMKKKINKDVSNTTNIVMTELSFPLIVEVLDQRTQKTIRKIPIVSEKSDFIQSNDLSSRLMAMVCEDRRIMIILRELLGADGHSFFLKKTKYYVSKMENISFFEVAYRAQQRGHCLVGYIHTNGLEDAVINPKNKHSPMFWDLYDLIIIAPSVNLLNYENDKNEEAEQMFHPKLAKGKLGFKGSFIDHDEKNSKKKSGSMRQSNYKSKPGEENDLDADFLARRSEKVSVINSKSNSYVDLGQQDINNVNKADTYNLRETLSVKMSAMSPDNMKKIIEYAALMENTQKLR